MSLQGAEQIILHVGHQAVEGTIGLVVILGHRPQPQEREMLPPTHVAGGDLRVLHALAQVDGDGGVLLAVSIALVLADVARIFVPVDNT